MPIMSKFELNENLIARNESEYSFLYKFLHLLIAKNYSLNSIECYVEIEFYGLNDKTKRNCSKFEKIGEKEVFLYYVKKYVRFYECFKYDSNKIKNQKIFSKLNPFLKISANEKLFSDMNIRTYLEIKLILNWKFPPIKEIFYPFNIRKISFSYSKASETYLESPFKSQCRHYNKNTSKSDCLEKCMIEKFSTKYKCYQLSVKEGYEIHLSNKEFLEYKFRCSEDMMKRYDKIRKECKNLCPIDCIKNNYIFKPLYVSNENDSNSERILNFFWDSGQPFILYEETANMLLLDYFTYIGGLFGLWFGICLENMMDIILNNAKNLKLYLKVGSKTLFSSILLFLKRFCISSLHFINYLMNKLFNSFKLFGQWFIICWKNLKELISKNVIILGQCLKLKSKMILSFIFLSLKLFYISFLYFMNWLIYIIIELFLIIKGIICLLIEKYIHFRIRVEF
jgi:hypothetical protein